MKTQKISKIQAFIKILRLIKPYWHFILISIFFSILASLLSGAIAWLVKPLFDKVFLPQNYKFFTYLPFIIAGIFFIRASSVFLQAYFMKKASYSLGKNLRARLYQKIVNMPFYYAIEKGGGEIVSRVINDVSLLESTLGDISRTFFLETITIFILIGVAFYRSWKLTLLTFTVIPFVAIASEWLAKKTHKNRHRMQTKLAELTHTLYETFSGLREIKIYLQQSKMVQFFSKLCEETYRAFLKGVKYEEGSKFIVNVLTGLAAALIVFYGGYLIKTHIITPGDFFSLFTAILMIFTPLKKLAGAYNRFHNALAGIERIEEIFSFPDEKGGKKKVSKVKKGFEFHKVSFRYPQTENFALKEVSIFLPAGKTIAIIGKSGAGKSTLVSLLPRFYDPTEGVVTLDGINLKEFKLSSLRNLFGIVSQEVVVFNMSIAENIALGKPNATREEIIEAAKLAYAHEFIEKLPQGYDTVLGKEGLSLSGGQKQRIAIARAILKNSPVLILDEATSHLDTVSERYVQMAIERLMKDRTTIVIAHRLSTVKRADYVIVLDEGKVVCYGTHAELEKTCPHYQRLYEFLEK